MPRALAAAHRLRRAGSPPRKASTRSPDLVSAVTVWIDGATQAQTAPTSADIISSLVECKQEPDNDFDLEQCAAALEKDPCFPGFVVDFMGDEAADDDTFKVGYRTICFDCLGRKILAYKI